MNGIDRSIGRIFTHGAVERLTQAYRESGVDLPDTTYAGSVTDKKEFAGSLIVAPPSAQSSTWLKRFGPQSTAFASGWMMVRGARRQRAVDRGFVLSDHADWPELLQAIEGDRGRNRLRHARLFRRGRPMDLNETGMNAVPLKTQFVGDDDDSDDMIDEESEPPEMKLFTELYVELDQTNKTNEKIEACGSISSTPNRPTPRGRSIFSRAASRGRSSRQSSFANGRSRMSGIPEWLFPNRVTQSATEPKRWRCFCRITAPSDETPLHTFG